MDKMIVTVFDSEKQAYEASQALRDLNFDGSVLINSGAVLQKDTDGNVQVRALEDEGPIGTAMGMAFGGLLGAVAGPAGMVAGTALGGWTGLLADEYNYDRGTAFVDEVADRLDAGKCAVVVQVDETWVAPVDARMEALGGEVHRRDLAQVEEDQWVREIEAEERALDELEQELEKADEEVRAEVQAKVDAAREKLGQTREHVQAKCEAFKADTHAKLDALDSRIQTATEEAKATLEERKRELKSDYDKRTTRLKEKWEEAKQALTA